MVESSARGGESPAQNRGLQIGWSAIYCPEWDDTPDAYQQAGLVGWGRSRRLARASDTDCSLRAYIGVQHVDPERWGVPGEVRAVFFLSVLIGAKTLYLRTFPTVAAVLAALTETHARICAETSAPGENPHEPPSPRATLESSEI